MSLASSLRASIRGIWGEHGAWAVVLPSYAAGVLMAWPPTPAALLLLPALVLLTASKGLAQRARRTGRGWGPLAAFVVSGLLCALPAALASPAVAGVVAAAAAPFAALYLWVADEPRWTRSLAVELYGTTLLASACGVAAAASGRVPVPAALLCWAAVGSLFPPGVLRARLGKSPTAGLRAATVLCAAAGAAVQAALVAAGFLAPWGLIVVAVFLGDLWAVWALPGTLWPASSWRSRGGQAVFEECWILDVERQLERQVPQFNI
jgi:hypothetical protein